MADLLRTGVSALGAFQRVLTTTGHNIANVNTPGFSRQVVDLGTRPADRFGDGFVGNGVDVQGVRRHYDDFLADRYRGYTASRAGFEIYGERVALIDNLLADPDAGLGTAFQGYFDAMQDVATDPTSVPARQVMLNEAEQLASRFRGLNAWLNDLQREVNIDFDNFTSEVNQLGRTLAGLNARIAEAGGSGQPPNDLLDERDRALDQLSELVQVSTVRQDNGAVNVFVGNGQALVVDGQASQLRAVNATTLGADQRRLQLVGPSGSAIDVTDQLAGGRLGGLLALRSEVLNPAQDQLGRLAFAFAQQTNTQHRAGMDLDGALGADLFQTAILNAGVVNAGGAATVSLSLVDPAALQATEYRLDFTAADGWFITPASTGVRELLGPGTSFTRDGLQIDVAGAPSDGDTHYLRPFRQAASGIAIAVTDPRAVAAADASAAPDGAGDNRNALALAELQRSRGLGGGTATYADAYGQLVADVGTRARESRDGALVQGRLADQVEAARQAVSGVNLDEEAANLVKFQQAYQAAAQVISVASTLFDTLLGAVRR